MIFFGIFLWAALLLFTTVITATVRILFWFLLLPFRLVFGRST